MKTLLKIFWLGLAFPLSCLAIVPQESFSTHILYTIEQSKSFPNILTVHVDRNDKLAAAELVLRGISMGISKQVQNVECDGKPIQENKPGNWSIPESCQKLQWQVPLIEGGTELAATQQSMKSGNFIIFSEISSLPRLKDLSTPEMIKISMSDINIVFPAANATGMIALPDISRAPFFVLMNAAEIGTVSKETLKLTYLLDNPKAVSRLPDIATQMKGLQWLNTIIPSKINENFVVAWLGISAQKVALAGATGNDMLLTNYPMDGEFPFGKSMLLYVALHEAFHQFAMHYVDQPEWVAESLASYYGVRALQVALPKDETVNALRDRFLKGGERFSDGLLAINRKVIEGDVSEYGAFYTKGIAFWLAVDKVLQQRGDSLDHHLVAVFQTKYSERGDPKDLQEILNLSPENWASLRNQYLD